MEKPKEKFIIDFIFRLIVLPVVALFIFISYFKSVFYLIYLFLFYGGEFVAFEKNDKEKIREILNQFKNK